MNNEKPLTQDEIINKIQDDKFRGKCFRMDGKTITENQVKTFVKEKQKKIEEDTYDPRKFKLKHGIRCKVAFKGSGISYSGKTQ
jgi:hypothetical protein